MSLTALTALTRQIEDKVAARLASRHAQLPVLPFQLANLNRSQYVLTGTTTRSQDARAGGRAQMACRDAATIRGAAR